MEFLIGKLPGAKDTLKDVDRGTVAGNESLLLSSKTCMIASLEWVGYDLPKAAATASQFGWMFSTARMVRMRRASFSAVHSMIFWPLGMMDYESGR